MKKLYALGSYLLSSSCEKPFVLLREIRSADNLNSNILNHWVRSEKIKQLIIANPKSVLNYTSIFITPEDAKEFMEEIKSKTWCPKDIHIIGLVFQDKEKKEND